MPSAMNTVSAIAALWRKLQFIRRGHAASDEIDEELRFHRDLLARDFEAQGLSPREAERAARKQFGNTLGARERSADEWRFLALDDVAHDVRFGLRLLKRSPMFAVVAIVAIGLAIGINTGFFTLVDTFIWRPIPVPRSDGLVKLALRYQTRGGSIVFSYPQVQAITRYSKSLSDVLPVGRCVPVALRASGARPAEPAKPLCVSGNYFLALGGSAAMGRALVPSDDREGAPPAIVISDPYWTRAFARFSCDRDSRRRSHSARALRAVHVVVSAHSDCPRGQHVVSPFPVQRRHAAVLRRGGATADERSGIQCGRQRERGHGRGGDRSSGAHAVADVAGDRPHTPYRAAE
jgi:hypothetical protein